MNYYQILSVPPTATQADIKKSYRKLARQYHPDTNTTDLDAEQRFKEIAEAYETLSDPKRRQRYDRTHGPFKDTTMQPVNAEGLDVASRMIGVLENTWQAIRRRHPEIPPVVIIIASGTDRKNTIWGHHAPDRWNVADQRRTEIMISGEGLRRGATAVLGTLLHEATHALAAARGIQDTSRQGRYHNQKFADLGRELGIDVQKSDQTGWSITSVPDPTIAVYADQLDALKDAMILWRRDETRTPAGKRNTNLIAAICPCGRTIRIAASSLTEAPVICGACDEKFQPKNIDA